jgi:hypothetical protein
MAMRRRIQSLLRSRFKQSAIVALARSISSYQNALLSGILTSYFSSGESYQHKNRRRIVTTTNTSGTSFILLKE